MTSVEAWSVDEVCTWLGSIGLDALAPKFRENAVSGKDLLNLDDTDYTESLGCTKLQMKKIRKALEAATPSRIDSLTSAASAPPLIDTSNPQYTGVPSETAASAAPQAPADYNPVPAPEPEKPTQPVDDYGIPPPLATQPGPPPLPQGPGGPYAAGGPPPGYPQGGPGGPPPVAPMVGYNQQPPPPPSPYSQAAPYAQQPLPGAYGQPPPPPPYGGGYGGPPPPPGAYGQPYVPPSYFPPPQGANRPQQEDSCALM